MTNKIIIHGRLTADPQIKTAGSATVCELNIAVNTRFKDQDGNYKTLFYRVSVWRARGETCAKHLHKGDLVGIIGDLDVRAYVDRNGQNRTSLEVNADEIDFLSLRRENSDEQSDAASEKNNATANTDNDDLPF